jgi:DNA polymerase-3 subunit gamma/tau
VSLFRERDRTLLAGDAVTTTKQESLVAVAAILARFPGAKIIDVRIPDAPDIPDIETDLPPEAAIEDDDDEN